MGNSINLLYDSIYENKLAIQVENRWINNYHVKMDTIGGTIYIIADNTYRYLKIKCNPGDIFTIYTTADINSNNRAYCITDVNDIVLYRDSSASFINGKTIVIPIDGYWLYVQDNSGIGKCYKRIDTDIRTKYDELKEIFNKSFDKVIGNKLIEFSDKLYHYYIDTSIEPLDISNPKIDTLSNVSYSVIECTEGDKFTLNGAGSVSKYYFYAFLDSNKNIISRATNTSTIQNNLKLIAPENTAYLIINNTTNLPCYYDYYLNNRIINNDDFNNLKNKFMLNNILVPEWEHGKIEMSDGSFGTSSIKTRTKSFIKPKGNKITINCVNTVYDSYSCYGYVYFYDLNDNYLGSNRRISLGAITSTQSSKNITIGDNEKIMIEIGPNGANSSNGYTVYLEDLNESIIEIIEYFETDLYTDTTLSLSGKPADSKIVGSAINNIIGKIPDYFESHIVEKIAVIRNKMKLAGRNSFSFIFFTDPHWPNNAKHTPELINAIIKQTNINHIICGGDILTEGTRVYSESVMTDMVNCFRKYNITFPTAYGNHDGNWNTAGNQWDYPERKFSENDVYALLEATCKDKMIYFATGFNFYIDYENNTRIIFLDSGDARELDGTIGIYYRDYNTLADQLMAADNKNIIIIIHAIYTDNIYRNLCTIATKYNNRETISTDYLSYNFNNATSHVYICIGGHGHSDKINKPSNTDIYYAMVDTDSLNTHNPEGATIKTITEQAFDVITVDYNTGNTYFTRIGRGSDREAFII